MAKTNNLAKNLFSAAAHPMSWERYRAAILAQCAIEERTRRARARRNLLDYIKLFHPEYQAGKVHQVICKRIDKFIDDCIAGKSPRLILAMPVRHGKSMICSENLPPYFIGKNPDLEVMQICHSEELCKEFGRKVRNRLNDPKQQDLFSNTRPDRSTNSVLRVAIENHRGAYRAAGVGGTITGRGAHLLIIDDPVKGRDGEVSESELRKQYTWYAGTARSRIMDGGGILIIMTRWHEADLVGEVLRVAEENPEADQWEVLAFPALAVDHEDPLGRVPGQALHEDRWPASVLRRTRATVPPRVWQCVYQQNPTPEEGAYFDTEALVSALTPITKLPSKSETTNYITCDLAISQARHSDYSVIAPVGITANDSMVWYPDVVRERLTAIQIVDTIVSKILAYNAREVIIERGHISHSLKELLKQRMTEKGVFCRIRDPAPTTDKQARAQALRGRIEMRSVIIADTPVFRDVILPEFAAFPFGKHDDTVDAYAWSANQLRHQVRPGKQQASSAESEPDELPRDSYAAIQKSARLRHPRSAHKKLGETPSLARKPSRLTGPVRYR